MLQHHRPPALMPLREQDAAASALVLHVLEAGDEVGHATETGEHARQRGPEAVRHAQEVTRQRFGSRFFFFFLFFRFTFLFGYTRFKLVRCSVFLSGGAVCRGGGNCKTGLKKSKRGETYWTVLPECFSTTVRARCRQTGQSTGAAASERFPRGIAVWYV